MPTVTVSRFVLTLPLLAAFVGCEVHSHTPASVTSRSQSAKADSSGVESQSGSVISGADGKDVVSVDSGNLAMDKAMQQARQTLDRFFAAHSAPGPMQQRFNLKVPLRAGNRVEYVWIDEVRIEDTSISGILLNAPFYSTAHKQGDRVVVPRTEIVDWSFIDEGYLVGGYTLRVMFEKYPMDQREALQRQLGYRIDLNKGT